MFVRCLLILIILLTYGCRVGPKYEKPITDIPKEWKSSPACISDPVKIDNWWEIFEDQELNTLEEKLIARNYDLYIAIQKVIEARAVAGIDKSNLYPKISLNGNYSYFQEFLKLHQKGKEKIPFIKDKITVYGQQYAFPNLLSYELDLWGKYRSQYQSSILHSESMEEEIRVSLLSLTSDLASHYFNLRSLDTQLFLLEKLIFILKEKANLEHQRYTQGLISYLDVTKADETLYKLESQCEETFRQRQLFENAIATLIGKPASQFKLTTSLLLEDSIPSIPGGLPSSVMLQRPDIAAAEKELASKHALVKSAYASFFPSFDLTSALGYTSLQFKDLLNINGFLWQVGASLAQSVFDAGQKKSNLNASWARFRQAEGAYQQLVLKAFQEVENSLNNIEQQNLKAKKTTLGFKESEKRVLLSQKRYNKGITNKLDLLINEQQLIENQQNTLNIRTLRYQATIELIKTLGGRWD